MDGNAVCLVTQLFGGYCVWWSVSTAVAAPPMISEIDQIFDFWAETVVTWCDPFKAWTGFGLTRTTDGLLITSVNGGSLSKDVLTRCSVTLSGELNGSITWSLCLMSGEKSLCTHVLLVLVECGVTSRSELSRRSLEMSESLEMSASLLLWDTPLDKLPLLLRMSPVT